MEKPTHVVQVIEERMRISNELGDSVIFRLKPDDARMMRNFLRGCKTGDTEAEGTPIVHQLNMF